MKTIISLSGGMDSSSLLLRLLAEENEVRAYSFDYGQKHLVELERVKQNIAYLQSNNLSVKHSIIDLRSVFNESQSALTSDTTIPEGHYAENNMKATVVENRNSIFSAILFGKALSWANQNDDDHIDIALGVHSGDHAIYPDCTVESRDSLLHAFRISNWGSHKVNYYTPYMLGDKTSILKDAVKNCEKLGLDFDTVFRNTNTCYNPDEFGRSCGKCGSCVERVESFLNIDKADPVEYQNPWSLVKANVIVVLQDNHK